MCECVLENTFHFRIISRFCCRGFRSSSFFQQFNFHCRSVGRMLVLTEAGAPATTIAVETVQMPRRMKFIDNDRGWNADSADSQ